MIKQIDREIVGMVYKLQVNMPEQTREERRRAAERARMMAVHQDTTGMGLNSARPEEEQAANPMAEASQSGKPKPFKRTVQKVGRNDPCPCGSGKKYKKCHGANE